MVKRWSWLVAVAGVVLLILALREADVFRGPRGTPETPPLALAESGEAAEERAPDAAARLSFQVLNLADAKPVEGIRIRATDAARAITADSGPDGTVSFTDAGEMTFEVADPNWAAAPTRFNRPRETGVFWVYNWIQIDGIVRVRGDAAGFDPKAVTIHVVFDGRDAPETLPALEPRARLVQSAFRPPTLSKDGRFRMRVPRVHGITVAATAHGYKTARQRVDVSRPTEVVELWLERALRIRGVLRSKDGTPLERVSITCLSLVKSPGVDITNEGLRWLKPEGGFTGSKDLVTGEAKAKFLTLAMTDKEGRFELSLPVEGEVLVVAFPFKHRPVYVDLGVLGKEDVNDLGVVAEPVATSSRVRIVANGKPVQGEKLFIADLSLKDGDAQPGVYVRLDAEGHIPTDWLIPDRRFHFQIDRYSGHLIWDGRDTLDVAEDLLPVSELPE